MDLCERICAAVSGITAIVKRRPKPAFEPAWLGRPGAFHRHHPVFSQFKPFAGSVPPEFEVGYIGTRTSREFLPAFTPRSSPSVACSTPAVDEEYFEWIDLLLSVRDAASCYTMIELGAGYGRWAVRAALAARQAGIENVQLGLVEAEPAHLEWLRQHLSNNGVSFAHARIYEGVVSDKAGKAEFYVGAPDDFNKDTPRTWYGQSISKDYEQVGEHGGGMTASYFGKPVITYASGWRAIEVDKIDIRDILRAHDNIDFLDLDIQGEEVKVLTAGLELVDRKVKRLHIGTHGSQLEAELRKLFHSRGWILLRDYGCHQSNLTPFGAIQFVDGVQSWINPRFKLSVA